MEAKAGAAKMGGTVRVRLSNLHSCRLLPFNVRLSFRYCWIMTSPVPN
jgi:hypothetical protein